MKIKVNGKEVRKDQMLPFIDEHKIEKMALFSPNIKKVLKDNGGIISQSSGMIIGAVLAGLLFI